ncbi:50S ribosomal protein L25/general stress protein Ctc [Propioniciclava flava]|uniref:Large ribosomal subunit protein bL25 n=1 Tax=Propioniciclava flava TaxID=2072026 RepID=A0A4Q2EIT9_9ACTN|nr:50S ribosomal protein L25/general stress protein Ctc [Propioniciclava flava]RXW33053.1 50S ribosomal protein L25 [Propioniciclava flava]
MSDELKLVAESRNEFGKGAARRIRRANKVPAVIYGHGGDPIHITLPGHETLLALRTANALLTLVIDGAEPELALPKQVQRDPITGFLEHVDLVIVKKGEKVSVEVPLLITGTIKEDRILVQDQQAITLEVEATNIPAHVEIDGGALQVGDQITAADLKLPAGAVFAGDPEELILSIAPAPTTEELDAELDAAVAKAGDEPAEAASEEAAE